MQWPSKQDGFTYLGSPGQSMCRRACCLLSPTLTIWSLGKTIWKVTVSVITAKKGMTYCGHSTTIPWCLFVDVLNNLVRSSDDVNMSPNRLWLVCSSGNWSSIDLKASLVELELIIIYECVAEGEWKDVRAVIGLVVGHASWDLREFWLTREFWLMLFNVSCHICHRNRTCCSAPLWPFECDNCSNM